MSLEDNLINRKWMMERLRAEVVGPDPSGECVVNPDGSGIERLSWEDFRKPRRQMNGEEVLWQDPPTKRYGAGVIFPAGVSEADSASNENLDESLSGAPPQAWELPAGDDRLDACMEKLLSRTQSRIEETEEYDVTLANAFKPSALGLSFLASFDRETKGISIELVSVGRLGANELCESPSAEYRKVEVKVGDKDFIKACWLRKPLLDPEGRYPRVELTLSDMIGRGSTVKKKTCSLPEAPGIEIVAMSRPWGGQRNDRIRLMTISLVNRRDSGVGKVDSTSIFQAGLRISGLSSISWILPYPEKSRLKEPPSTSRMKCR